MLRKINDQEYAWEHKFLKLILISQ